MTNDSGEVIGIEMQIGDEWSIVGGMVDVMERVTEEIER